MVPNQKMWTQFGVNYNVFAHVAPFADHDNDKKIKAYAKEMGIKGKVIVAHSKEWRVLKV
jgi:hypothetical protein